MLKLEGRRVCVIFNAGLYNELSCKLWLDQWSGFHVILTGLFDRSYRAGAVQIELVRLLASENQIIIPDHWTDWRWLAWDFAWWMTEFLDYQLASGTAKKERFYAMGKPRNQKPVDAHLNIWSRLGTQSDSRSRSLGFLRGKLYVFSFQPSMWRLAAR